VTIVQALFSSSFFTLSCGEIRGLVGGKVREAKGDLEVGER